MVEGIGRDPAALIGEALVFHLIDALALHTDALGRKVAGTTGRAARAHEGHLPALVTPHRRGCRALRVGSARWLEGQHTAPLQVAVVGEVVVFRRDPAVHRVRWPTGLDAVGHLEDHAVAAVTERGNENAIAKKELLFLYLI